MEDSSWRFDEINSRTFYFHKTTESNGSIYEKIPLRSSAILNSENIDIYCFFRSLLASVHPCQNIQPRKV